MKLKKIVFILIICLLLTGCSGKVNIKINDKDEITQNVKTINYVEDLEFFGMTKEEYIKNSFEFYGKKYFNDYKMKEYIDEEKFGVNFSNKSNDICNFLNKSYFSKFFRDLTCTENRNYFEIKASNSSIYCGDDCDEPNEVTDVSIEIELPQKAIESNADSEEGTKYIWNYDFNNNNDLYIKFKKNNTFLKKIFTNDNSNKESLESAKYMAIIIFSIVGFCSLVAGILYIKYKKNKLKY